MSATARRRKKRSVPIELKRQEWEDLLNAITFTQYAYDKGKAPEFMAALERLRVKLWKSLPAFKKLEARK